MARHPRILRPQTVHHAIARFAKGEYRIRDEQYRAAYFDHLGRALARSDWRVLSACAMCSHTHLGLWAGFDPAEQLFRSLHTRYAMWLNKADGQFGPVYAERPWLVAFEGDNPLALIAYHHNNPVHAKLVTDPAESTWSTHRAYVGLTAAPPWLDVERGLSLCGFDSSPRGRSAFHDAVCALSHQPIPAIFRGDTQTEIRRRVREACGAPVETATPTLHAPDCAPRVEIVARGPSPLRPRWEGDVTCVLATIGAFLSLPEAAIRSRARTRALVRARRIALAVWVSELHRAAREMACALGLSEGAAAQLRASGLTVGEAELVAEVGVVVRRGGTNPLGKNGRN